MLDKDAITKDVGQITDIVNKIDLALTMEDDRETRNKLSSANGQLKAGRAWLIKLLKEMPK